MPKAVRVDHVHQKEVTGCLVASVSMILGISYEAAKRKLFKNRPTPAVDFWGLPSHGSSLINVNDLGTYLKQIDLDVVESRARQFKNIKSSALCILTWTHEPEVSHAFVWHEKTLFDPLRWNPLSEGHIFRKTRNAYEKQLRQVFYVDIAKARQRLR